MMRRIILKVCDWRGKPSHPADLEPERGPDPVEDGHPLGVEGQDGWGVRGDLLPGSLLLHRRQPPQLLHRWEQQADLLSLPAHGVSDGHRKEVMDSQELIYAMIRARG